MQLTPNDKILEIINEILEEIKWAKDMDDEIHTKASLNIVKEKVKEIKKIINND